MSDIVDMIRKPFQDSKFRADCFCEQEEYPDAISEYIEAIEKLTDLVKISAEVDGSGSEKSMVNGSLLLGTLYDHIAFCYRGCQMYHRANAFLDKASQTYRVIRNSGATLNTFHLESLEKQEETVKKAKNSIKLLIQQDNGCLDSESDINSYDFTSITDINELPTSFMNLPKVAKSSSMNKVSESSSINTSYSSDSDVIGDKILFGFSLFFVVVAIISLFSGRWFDVIIALVIASYGRIFVIYILGSFIKF